MTDLVGSDFGIGSSREHAVWALTDYGFRAVISERFGDIFRNNATKGGLLPVRLPAAEVSALQDAVEGDPECVIAVDLAAREVSAAPPGGGAPLLVAPFNIDDYTRWRLMEGLDDISLTLRHADDITSFKHGRGRLAANHGLKPAENLPRDGFRGFDGPTRRDY